MLIIKCPIANTEDFNVIKKILDSFFSADFKLKEGALVSEVNEEIFKKACEKSNSIAFEELLKNKEIEISKMALFKGKVNIEYEHPLGSVKIILE